MHPARLGGIAFILIGSLLILLGVWLTYSELSTQNDWVSSTGMVQKSGVREFIQERRDGGNTMEITMYRPKVNYSYEFEGKQFVGTCCSFSSNIRGQAEDYVNKHPEGTTLDIFVNSKKPELSRVGEEKGTPLMIFLALIAFGIIAILGGRHLLKKKDNEWVPAARPGAPPAETQPLQANE